MSTAIETPRAKPARIKATIAKRSRHSSTLHALLRAQRNASTSDSEEALRQIVEMAHQLRGKECGDMLCRYGRGTLGQTCLQPLQGTGVTSPAASAPANAALAPSRPGAAQPDTRPGAHLDHRTAGCTCRTRAAQPRINAGTPATACFRFQGWTNCAARRACCSRRGCHARRRCPPSCNVDQWHLNASRCAALHITGLDAGPAGRQDAGCRPPGAPRSPCGAARSRYGNLTVRMHTLWGLLNTQSTQGACTPRSACCGAVAGARQRGCGTGAAVGAATERTCGAPRRCASRAHGNGAACARSTVLWSKHAW